MVVEALRSGRPGSPHRPDPLGHFGAWGGRFVPEVLMAALDQLTEAFEDAIADPSFNDELDALRRDYAGRPTPLFCARRLSEELGLRVWLKHEDLAPHRDPQDRRRGRPGLLTQRMGKRRVIAETGAGQHSVGPPPSPPCSGSHARCTWARRTSAARR